MSRTEVLSDRKQRQVPVSAELAEEAKEWGRPPRQSESDLDRPRRAAPRPRTVQFDLD